YGRWGWGARRPTQAELSGMLGLSPSAFTRLVDRAARRGLVRRVQGVSRRANTLELTQRGWAAWERLEKKISAVLPVLFQGVTRAEGEVALRVLRRVSRRIEEEEEER
ncbi:MAG: MarR family transcriptional regulator, partial [bacterium]|nr:MarR family transcriptional regulator [bacterium]